MPNDVGPRDGDLDTKIVTSGCCRAATKLGDQACESCLRALSCPAVPGPRHHSQLHQYKFVVILLMTVQLLPASARSENGIRL